MQERNADDSALSASRVSLTWLSEVNMGTAHPAISTDWRRELCLGGCGKKVSKQRGALEVGGTVSGSWLIAWEWAAHESVSTDPAYISEEQCYLLGASHRECLNKSLTRIRSGEIFFDETTLQRVYFDDIPWRQLTPLQLPAGSNDCPFCDQFDGSNLTDEHVWPDWLQTELLVRGVYEKKPGAPFVPVCHNCNTRWMSTLEQDAMRHLPELWEEEFRFDAERQRILASWAICRAIVLDRLSSPPSIPRGFGHDLRVTRQPPSDGAVSVWAILLEEPEMPSWIIRRLKVAPVNDFVEPEQPNFTCVTFSVYNVLFQVLFSFHFGQYTLQENYAFSVALTQLWPLGKQPVTWPRGRVNSPGAIALAERFCAPDASPSTG